MKDPFTDVYADNQIICTTLHTNLFMLFSVVLGPEDRSELREVT